MGLSENPLSVSFLLITILRFSRCRSCSICRGGCRFTRAKWNAGGSGWNPVTLVVQVYAPAFLTALNIISDHNLVIVNGRKDRVAVHHNRVTKNFVLSAFGGQ